MMILLEDKVLESVCGGVSPNNVGAPRIDAILDSRCVGNVCVGGPIVLVSNAQGAPAAGNLLPVPIGEFIGSQRAPF